MTTKAYLSQARLLDARIDSKLEQVERLRSLAERTTTVLSSQPKGCGGTNRTEYVIERVWELEREINEDIDRLIGLKREICGVIEAVENEQYRLLLEYRYLCRKTWPEVRDIMGVDERWMYRMHGKALQEIQI